MLFTLLSLALFVPPVQEKVLANKSPSITGTVQDEKGQTVSGAILFVFSWTTAPREGRAKSYL